LPGIGLSLKGAHRWINLGFTVIQPSELLKITLTLYLAAWFSVKEKGRLLAFLLLLGACVFLVIAEPDLGTTTIITATAILVYFFQGAKIKEIIAILVLFLVAVFFLIKLEPYRAARFAEYMNFNTKDFSTTSYHVKQILVALGSGGVSGVGFGRSVQKYAYLPENTTDSIFAIYSEEAGFIGSFVPFMGLKYKNPIPFSPDVDQSLVGAEITITCSPISGIRRFHPAGLAWQFLIWPRLLWWAPILISIEPSGNGFPSLSFWLAL
jgi:cell division protein FtsW (lipid II flippase)